ncbi:MAG: hypothetical protein JNM98_18150 [Rhodocyclaceae bacterium]|nr:hypothetical protein [Rhodocyclaceae bacterium]
MTAEYTIRTVADFAKVPADKIGACLADFAGFLSLAREAAALEAELQRAFSVPAGATRMDESVFIWIDDGVHGVSALEFSDAETGANIGRLRVVPGEAN